MLKVKNNIARDQIAGYNEKNVDADEPTFE